MARAGGEGLELPHSEDDLIEISVQIGTGSELQNRREHRSTSRPIRPPAQPGARRSFPARLPSPAQVIDLTAEPDTPEEQRQSQSRGSRVTNPRRTSSQRQSAPRLARSDSTFMAPFQVFVDLTADSPDNNENDNDTRPIDSAPLRPSRNQARFARNPYNPQQHRPLHAFRPDQIFQLEIRDGDNGPIPELSRTNLAREIQRITGYYEEPWGHGVNIAQGNFMGTFSPREESPKPPMENLAPVREGFTRDTCSRPDEGQETVFVCPTCLEELAYEPSDTAVQGSAGGKKRKRVSGDHHFWALKQCGHVYCADCFENRRPSKAAPHGRGFRAADGKSPAGPHNDLRCAVEGCETKVLAKNDWVGIFL